MTCMITKTVNMAGVRNLKVLSFLETAHESLHLLSENWSMVHWKITDISKSFICIVIFFNEAFKYGNGAKLWGYLETNAKPLLSRIL
jgi:hypothetical protein